MADGFSLNIDAKFLRDLQRIDEKYQKLMDKNNQLSKSVISAYQEMSSKGVTPYVKKLQEQKEALEAIANIKLSKGAGADMRALQDGANKAVDNINRLLNALKNTKQYQKETSTFSDASKVNALYSERIELMRRLEGYVQKGMKGELVTEQESNSISVFRQRLMNIDSEIKAIQNMKTISTDVYMALIKGEIDFTNAKNAEIQKRNAITNQFKDEEKKKNQQILDDIFKYEQDKFNESLNQYRKNKDTQASVDKHYHDKRQREYEEMFRKIDELAKRESEMRSKSYSRIQSSGDTSKQATAAYNRLYSDKGIKSLNNMNRVLQQLQDAQNKLNLDTKEGKKQYEELGKKIQKVKEDIDKATNSNQKFGNSQSKLLNTSDQLQRKLALLFSVSAIQGYINKLIEVRGEFEMQQRSLQVLLQNKDEANALWDKTVALAVKSPFRVKDLVTYTKQLAAYRVESDKLYETNRMLADVSAGLGVDMNRLILAYGQVKAAAYLRGTELRQFSEAGVNMLGELSKYFTEIEGRAVSVGDVFERVSKRMVSFEHVNEIFRRLTSEGGIFFQMQEKQSETLQGMVMNFRDSMDLMLNDIGKSQSSMLKDSIRLAKEMVENWRALEPIIKTIGTTFLAAFGAKTLIRIVSAFKALSAVFSANPYTAAAAAVGVLLTAIYQACQYQSKLNALMQEVESENVASLQESIGLYRKLAETINDATKSYEERDKAMSQLKNKFSEILPDQYTELQYIEKLSDNYHDAEQAMFDYYNAKAREQKKARIEQEFASEIEGTDIPELLSSINNITDRLSSVNSIAQEAGMKIKSGLSGVVNSLVDDIKNGKIDSSIDEFNKEFVARMQKFTGLDERTVKMIIPSELVQHQVGDLVKTLNKYTTALNGIKGLNYETYDQEVAANIINQEKEYLNTAVNSFKKAASLYQKYVDAFSTSDETVGEKREKIEKDVQAIIEALPEEMKAYSVYLKQAFSEMKSNADSGKFDFAKVLQTIEASMYATFNDKGELSDGLAKIAFDRVKLNENANDAAKEMIKNFKEGLSNKAAALAMNDFQKTTIKAIELIADKFGVSADTMAKFVPRYGEALSDVRKRVLAEKEMMDDAIQAWDASFGTGLDINTGEMLGYTKEQIDLYRILTKAFSELAKAMGYHEKGSGKRDKTIDERIKVIDDMNKKYKELNRTLSKTESLKGAFDAYKDAFASAYNRSDVKSMTAEQFAKNVLNFPNEDDIVKWFDNLAKTTKNQEDKIKVELKKGDYVMDLRVRTKVEDDKLLIDQIEDMFSGYELSLELQKMNIPPDLAKNLFNLDAVSLDELRNQLKSRKGEFIGTEREEDYKKYLKKIDELEEKAQLERLKKYTKYLVQAQSERVKIKLEEMRQLNEIDKESKYSQDQKDVIKRAIRVETQEKIDKEAWEDFKKSDMYSQMFDDLEHLGTQAVTKLKQKLESLKESLQDLPPTELKEIMSQINKLEDLEMKYNPFSSLRDAMKEVNALRKEGRSEEFLQLELQSANERIESTQEEIDAIDTILNAKRENISLEQQSVEWQEKYGKYVGLTEDMLNQQKNELSQIVEQNQKTAKQAGLDLSKYTKARKATQGFVDNVTKWGEAISGVLGGIDSVLDAFGVAEDDSSRIFVQSAEQIANMIVQTVILTASLHAMGVAANSALGVIGWIATALQAVAMLFASIFASGDKSKERQIKKEQEAVEKLQRAYEKLAESIDNAYNINSYERYIDNAQQNLKNQIAATERMIQAEEDKKKTDKDKIRGWKNEIEDMKETLKELEEERIKGLGGFGSESEYKSATEAFVSAWLDAYKETGDGLSGLEEQFNEFFTNMVKNQLMMRGVDRYLDGFYRQFDAMFAESSEQGGKVTKNELESLKNLWASTAPELNEFMENLIEGLGIAKDLTSGTSELSGLQRGIQGVTEETAQIIEAYLNSIRFFVAEQNTYLSQIASAFGNTEVENPMVGQLRIIAQQTTAINTLLQSLTRGGHTLGGVGLKVFIS
jgi:hypothetical protein